MSHSGYQPHDQRLLTRTRLIRLFLVVAGLAVLAECPVYPQGHPRLEKFETSDVRLVFLDPNTSYLVPHAVRCFENALSFHRRFWDYTPTGRTNILFNDFTDVGNGGTLVIPRNFLNIAVAPFDYSFSVIPNLERMQWLMSHELTHQVMCDKSSRSDLTLRRVFGGRVVPDNRDPESLIFSYLTTPRWYSPRWYQEGIAVFMETWMSGGLGRVMGGYDEMVFRTMVRDSSYFYNVVGLETEGTTIDFQVGVNAYLYGARFVSFLAWAHGLDKLKEFYSRTDSSKRFYASQFKQVYGVPVQKEWDKWIEWEHGFQAKNLAVIRKFPVSRFRKITEESLGSVSRQFYDRKDNRIIVAVNYPGRLSYLASIDPESGKVKKIAPVDSPGLYYVTSLAYDDSTGTVFMSTQNKDWRGLLSVDVRSGKITNLSALTRTGNLVMDPVKHVLWGVQTVSGRTSLVRFKPPYDQYEVILTLPYGQEMFDPDISPDGTLLAATFSDVAGQQRLGLIRMDDLLTGKKNFEMIYEFEDNTAANFVFSPDNRYLYGTSYYTGVSNIFRIALDTREAALLSNAETGYFRPLPVSDDSMLVFHYTHEGMEAGMMKIDSLADVNAIRYLGQMIYEKYPEVESWTLPPPSTVDLDSMKVSESRYRPMKEMRLAGAYPILQGFKNYLAAGYRVDFMDPMGLSSLKLKLSVTPYGDLPNKQIPHLSAEYTVWNWTFTGNYNYADFYDLFGPTKFSRAGYSISTRYHKILNRFSPRRTDYYIRLTAYGDLETLPDYQNVASTIRNLLVGTINFHKSRLRSSLGAVEPEQGYDWNLFATASLAKRTLFPQLISNFDFGFLLPVRNTSLWFRTSAGQSFGPEDETNSYFFFGGFGNNYIDYRDVKQYRDRWSFPGREINAVPALNYGKVTGELNLRPFRFRRLGIKGFYSTYARLSLFTTGLFTNVLNGQGEMNYYTSGGQIDLELVFFSLLKSTLSLGYARDWELPGRAGRFMVSLKL